MSPSSAPQHDQDKRELELRRLRAQYEILKREADKAEIITGGVESPFWKVVIEPLLLEHIRQFQESDSWNTPKEEFEKARGKAQRSLELRDHILKRVGKRAYYLGQAERIAKILEAEAKRSE